MLGIYTEADYENSVIELFRNQLGYEYIYAPDTPRDFYSPLYDEVWRTPYSVSIAGCLPTLSATPCSS